MGARGNKTGHTRRRRRNKRGIYGTYMPYDTKLGPEGSHVSLAQKTKSESENKVDTTRKKNIKKSKKK